MNSSTFHIAKPTKCQNKCRALRNSLNSPILIKKKEFWAILCHLEIFISKCITACRKTYRTERFDGSSIKWQWFHWQFSQRWTQFVWKMECHIFLWEVLIHLIGHIIEIIVFVALTDHGEIQNQDIIFRAFSAQQKLPCGHLAVTLNGTSERKLTKVMHWCVVEILSHGVKHPENVNVMFHLVLLTAILMI